MNRKGHKGTRRLRHSLLTWICVHKSHQHAPPPPWESKVLGRTRDCTVYERILGDTCSKNYGGVLIEYSWGRVSVFTRFGGIFQKIDCHVIWQAIVRRHVGSHYTARQS